MGSGNIIGASQMFTYFFDSSYDSTVCHCHDYILPTPLAPMSDYGVVGSEVEDDVLAIFYEDSG